MSDKHERQHRLLRLLGPGGDADALFPGLRAHLAGCPACGEEHDALLDFVRAVREA